LVRIQPDPQHTDVFISTRSDATLITVLSLGAGVQSTTVALMAAVGEIKPMPDCAIFADTRWEPKAVYDHLDRLTAALPFPVHVVSAGNLREDQMTRSNTTKGRFAAIPWYILSPKGKAGMGRRQCTQEYKLKPIKKLIVELLGGKRPKSGCEMWIGISTDEAVRMKPSRVAYITNRFPLIERNMSRQACKEWLSLHEWDAPRSACIGCPFRKDSQWRALTSEEFADAVEVDKTIRNQPGYRGQLFAHRSMKPLSEVDFSTVEERDQLNMFNNECEGMCGV